MFVYYDLSGDIRFYSESIIDCDFDYIEQDLTDQDKVDLQNINNDRKVEDGEIVIKPKTDEKISSLKKQIDEINIELDKLINK